MVDHKKEFVLENVLKMNINSRENQVEISGFGPFGANPQGFAPPTSSYQLGTGGDVEFQVENGWTHILHSPPFLLGVFDQELRYPTQVALAMEAGFVAQDGWDGWIRLLRKPTQANPSPRVPTGLLSALIRLTQKFGFTYRIHDSRNKPASDVPEMVTIPLRDYQETAVEAALKAGRGVLDMPPRCHALGEKVLRADGSLAFVDHIRVGDHLLGPDGGIRVVLEVHRGQDELYRVTPRFGGRPFVVNQHHLLALDRHKRHGGPKYRRWVWDELAVPVGGVNSLAQYSRKSLFLKRVAVDCFPESPFHPLPISPYALGVIIGDGYLKGCLSVTTSQPVLQEALLAEGGRLGLRGCHVARPKDRAPVVYLTNGRCYKGLRRANPLVAVLRGLGLWGVVAAGKRIPGIYLRASKADRLSLLAGLLDTDGYLANGGVYFEFSTASMGMVDDFQFLCHSLGFCCTHRDRWVNGILYHRLNVLGGIGEIPTRVPHKKTKHKSSWRDVRRTSFRVEPVGVGEYVGFTVDGGHQYLDDTFTVQNNSGKTRCGAELVRRLALPTVWLAPTDRIVTQTHEVLEGFFGQNYAVHLVGSRNWETSSRKRIVVCTTATAINLPQDFWNTRKCLISDEFHHGGSKSYKDIFERCEHIYYRFGMTGTFFRSGPDEMAMHALLSNTVYKITSRELLARGYLVPVKVVFIPVAGHLRGVGSGFQTGHGKAGIHEHTYRQSMVAHVAHYLQTTGRRVLVLVGTKKQGRDLETVIRTLVPRAPDGCQRKSVEFICHDTPKTIQGEILESFVAGREVKVLIGTSIVGEGVDLPTTDSLVYAKGEKAEVTLVQNAYRVATAAEGKDSAIIVDFADRHHRKLLQHAQERLRIYHEEPSFEVKVLQDPQEFPQWLQAQGKKLDQNL